MPLRKVTVLVPMSGAQRARLTRKARRLRLSIGELLRRGAEQYTPETPLAAVDLLAKEIIYTSNKALQSIDTTLRLVVQSEARIQALESSRSAHQVGR